MREGKEPKRSLSESFANIEKWSRGLNIKMIREVRAITDLDGHKDVDSVNPSALLESEG